MNVEEARKMADTALQQLAAALERGQSETLKTYLAAMGKFPRYSPNNVWLILSQRPGATSVAGYTCASREIWPVLRRKDLRAALVRTCRAIMPPHGTQTQVPRRAS